MTVDRFAAQRAPVWSELEETLQRARRHPERLGVEGVRRLGSLYRSAAADLATARRRFPGDPLVDRLERLVGQARHVVYDTEPRRTSMRAFLGRGYWRRVRERPAVLAVAALLLVGPGALGLVWGLADPGGAAGLVPSALRSVTEPRQSTDLGLDPDTSAAFAAAIFTNNIRVTLLAFAGGITLGLLTGAVLAYNGALLGAVLGLAVGSGNGQPFVELVAPHGILELSCIVVSGAAGLRMGWAVVDPGLRRRATALQQEARAAVELALGTAPWLVLAGLVEGFVTPEGLGLGPAVVVGLAFGAAYWALVALRGGPEPSP